MRQDLGDERGLAEIAQIEPTEDPLKPTVSLLVDEHLLPWDEAWHITRSLLG